MEYHHDHLPHHSLQHTTDHDDITEHDDANCEVTDHVVDPCHFDHFDSLTTTTPCEPTLTSEAHEIAAQVAAMRTIQNPQYFSSEQYTCADDSSIVNHRGPKKKEFRKLKWSHLKTIYTNNSPYGLLLNNSNSGVGGRSSHKSKPIDITDEESVLIAKQSRDLFPVGFYEMTCKKRGVTKGRGTFPLVSNISMPGEHLISIALQGEWRDKETLKLVHCGAERQGCKFKVRYFRVIAGIEVWTNGEHDYLKHQVPSKRGLSPDARQYVTEHHRESQRAILDGLIDRGLINPLDEAAESKIKQQIKRRKLTVKTNDKIQRSLALQNDPADFYQVSPPPIDIPLLQDNTADSSIEASSIVGGVCLDDMAATVVRDTSNLNYGNSQYNHSIVNHDEHSTSLHVDDDLVAAAAEAATSTGDYIYKDPTEHMPTFV